MCTAVQCLYVLICGLVIIGCGGERLLHTSFVMIGWCCQFNIFVGTFFAEFGQQKFLICNFYLILYILTIYYIIYLVFAFLHTCILQLPILGRIITVFTMLSVIDDKVVL